jgi:hypothetical protein
MTFLNGLLVIAFWGLGLAGALGHLLFNFVAETPDERETWPEFKAFFRKRLFKLALSCLLFTFIFFIWLGMRSWGVNFPKLAAFQGIMYGVFMSVAGWAADSLWKNGTAIVERKAREAAGPVATPSDPPAPPAGGPG